MQCAFSHGITERLVCVCNGGQLNNIKVLAMKFAGIILFCSAVLFAVFTFVTAHNTQIDNWSTFGWPLVFLKRFHGDDFFLGADYFFWNILAIDILICVAISSAMVTAAWLLFNRKTKRNIAHQ